MSGPDEAGGTGRIPTSGILENLLQDSTEDLIGIGWMMDRLGGRSFGIVLLLLSLFATLPGISALAGIIIAFPAFQMTLARPVPVLPPLVARRSISRRRLAPMLTRMIPPLRFVERLVRPRLRMSARITKQGVGAMILLLDVLLFAPVPLSNVPPALVITLLALAYLEEDGLLIAVAMTLGGGLLLVGAAAAWEALSTTGWVPGFL